MQDKEEGSDCEKKLCCRRERSTQEELEIIGEVMMAEGSYMHFGSC